MQYISETERAERAARMMAATEKWAGVVFEYGRTVESVGIDDKDRTVLYLRAPGETGQTPVLAADYIHPDDEGE
jgi:hypothetical protein